MENYLQTLFPQASIPKLDQARRESERLGKAQISLGDLEARLMATLIRSHGCKKIVEIGTLTGASALWILQGMGEGGKLWTFEKDSEHAKSARETLSGMAVTVVEGDAVETLPSIEPHGPFDGIFIDGNKGAYGQYLLWAENNLKRGALILADNVFLKGAVFENAQASERFSLKQVDVMRKFNQRLADPSLYMSSVVPTVEGLFMAVKLT